MLRERDDSPIGRSSLRRHSNEAMKNNCLMLALFALMACSGTPPEHVAHPSSSKSASSPVPAPALSTEASDAKSAPSAASPDTALVDSDQPDAVIPQVMKREYPRFRPCFETMVGAGLNLSTRVVVEFTIEADGSVSGVSKVEDEFAREQFIDCVLHEVGELRFPRLEQWPIRVRYPIGVYLP